MDKVCEQIDSGIYNCVCVRERVPYQRELIFFLKFFLSAHRIKGTGRNLRLLYHKSPQYNFHIVKETVANFSWKQITVPVKETKDNSYILLRIRVLGFQHDYS